MACIAVRLWCPHSVPLNQIVHVVNSSLQTMNIPPPFTDTLQRIIDSSFPESDRMQAHCFRLNFPRGPVISTEPLQLTRHQNMGFNVSSALLRGLIDGVGAINLESIHMGSARPMGDTIIRDMEPDELEHMIVNRGFIPLRRQRGAAPVQRRPISIPSHVCSLQQTCAICLTDTQIGEVVNTLPCCHVFHKKCMTPWLAQGGTTCPTCRRDLTGV